MVPTWGSIRELWNASIDYRLQNDLNFTFLTFALSSFYNSSHVTKLCKSSPSKVRSESRSCCVLDSRAHSVASRGQFFPCLHSYCSIIEWIFLGAHEHASNRPRTQSCFFFAHEIAPSGYWNINVFLDFFPWIAWNIGGVIWKITHRPHEI